MTNWRVVCEHVAVCHANRKKSFSPEIISHLINSVGLCVHTHAKLLMALEAIKIIAILKGNEGLLTQKSTSQCHFTKFTFNLAVPVLI